MDVWRLTVAVLRRWYVLLPLLALTAVAALQAGEGIRPEYQVSATAMLVPGRVDSEVANPYGGLDDASQIVSIVLDSNESRTAIAEQGLNPSYEVSSASRTTIMNFAVRDATPDGGVATLEAVIAAAEAELQTRQDQGGVPRAAQFGIDTLAAPAVSAVVADSKMRVMAIVGALGAAISFVVAILFDDMVGIVKRWRRRRRDRNRKSEHGGTSDGATEEPTSEGARAPGDPGDSSTELSPGPGSLPATDPADSHRRANPRAVSDGEVGGADADDARLARAGRDG